MKQLSIGQLADLTGFAWRTVKSRIEAAGLQPVGRRGNAVLHDAPQALAAVYAVERVAPGNLDLEQERARLARAQSEKYERENDVRKGWLADLRVVSKFWTECMANMRARLLNMGPKLGPQLVNLGDPNLIAAAIRAEVYAALAELADYEPGLGADGVAGSAEGAEATADADREPVGRPRKKAK